MKRLFLIYCLFVHVFLGVLFVKSEFFVIVLDKLGYAEPASKFTPFYRSMVAFHKRINNNLPQGTVIFIGDSITQGLAVSAVAPLAVNFGIGHDTTLGVLDRIKHYSAINRSKAIVIAIGVNDLRRRGNDEIFKNISIIITELKSNAPVLVNAILPINEAASIRPGFNKRIRALNKAIGDFCSKDRSVHCLDISDNLIDEYGELSNSYHNGDGIHLNKSGYEIWIRELKAKLTYISLV